MLFNEDDIWELPRSSLRLARMRFACYRKLLALEEASPQWRSHGTWHAANIMAADSEDDLERYLSFFSSLPVPPWEAGHVSDDLIASLTRHLDGYAEWTSARGLAPLPPSHLPIASPHYGPVLLDGQFKPSCANSSESPESVRNSLLEQLIFSDLSGKQEGSKRARGEASSSVLAKRPAHDDMDDDWSPNDRAPLFLPRGSEGSKSRHRRLRVDGSRSGRESTRPPIPTARELDPDDDLMLKLLDSFKQDGIDPNGEGVGGESGGSSLISTKVKGVYYVGKTKTWLAQWREDGRTANKCFSASRYGAKVAREMAILTRLSMVTDDPHIREETFRAIRLLKQHRQVTRHPAADKKLGFIPQISPLPIANFEAANPPIVGEPIPPP